MNRKTTVASDLIIWKHKLVRLARRRVHGTGDWNNREVPAAYSDQNRPAIKDQRYIVR
jgi:hypothetical protein